MLSELFKRNRRLLNASTQDPRRRSFISPAVYATDRVLLPALAAHARGALLDVGAGDVPYRSLLAGQVTRYDTLDVEHRTETPRTWGTSTTCTWWRMAPTTRCCACRCWNTSGSPTGRWGAGARAAAGGTLILTVPHLSRLHEEPHDYYRYTQTAARPAGT